MKKIIYINFFDRKNVRRLTIQAGETIPPGIIISKGWRVEVVSIVISEP